MPAESNAMSSKTMLGFMKALYPMHRTVNSDDIERAIEMCDAYIGAPGYEYHAYPAKSDQLTWWVPERYKVNEAWLEIDGQRVADFAENPLHLLSYSLPQQIDGTLGEIRDHIWSREDRPDDIPWEFKYYERSWGFCLRHNDLIKFDDSAPVKGVIDVEFQDAPLPVGEFHIPGTSGRDLLFLTNICHPMQVNDSLAGLVVGVEMARQLLARPEPSYYGLRLLIVPETIGTIAWFANNQDKVDKLDYAWFCEMVGNDNSFILQLSREGDTLIDRAFLTAMRSHRKHGEERTGKFRYVVASDEIITDGPGYEIPTPSLTRWPYPEYHTSADNPDIVTEENLDEALAVITDVFDIMNRNYYPRRQFKGPVMLSRHGLWVDWREDWDLNLKIEEIMLALEGDKSVVDIAFELGLPYETVARYLDKFHDVGLITKHDRPVDQST
jgi:aminopeptidase-like protein